MPRVAQRQEWVEVAESRGPGNAAEVDEHDARVGIALQAFRLVRFDGAGGCTHHLLARAGRPSYPNYSQTAEDAADNFANATFATLTQWCARWWVPMRCRASDHSVVFVGETDCEGVWYPETSQEIDLLEGPGMRMVDIWVAVGPGQRLALALTDDAERFWSAVEAEPPEDGDDFLRPGEGLRVLFLTDRSGSGDLRDL